MLNELIKLINNTLGTAFKGGVFYGITEMIPTVESDIVRFYPSVINDGECVQMALDNLVTIQGYHRLTSKNTALKDVQYGGNNRQVIDTYNMSLFVIGNRSKLKSSASDTSLKITSVIPDSFNENGKQIAFTILTNVDFNSSAIINSEFPNADYQGMPDLFMIRHDYNIRHIYTKKCLACESECKDYSTN